MALKNLWQRVQFVIWAVPLTLILCNIGYDFRPLFPKSCADNLHPIYIATFMGIAMVLFAAHEYFAMLSREFTKNRFYFIYVWLVPTLLASVQVTPFISFTHSLYLLLMLVALESFAWGEGTQRWKRASLLFSGTIFLYLAGNSLLQFYQSDFVNLWRWNFPGSTIQSGNWGFIITIATIFMCDSAAYFVGSSIGKHHLSSISPKKTIEGSIGGLVASIIIMTVAMAFGRSEGTPLYLGVLLGIVIGIFAQVGDLTVSLMKRYFDVKDTSNLIPGHGGMLDRFDSLFFTAPVIHLVIAIVLKLNQA